MMATCVVDAVEFQAQRSTAKYCSERCKKRAKRARQSDPTVNLDLVGAVQRELVQLGATDTPDGQKALALAERMQNGSQRDTGSAFAAVSRELGIVMDRVKAAGMKNQRNPLDELAKRREAARGAA